MAGIVQIGKHRWLAGMTWLSYESVPSKADLREDAERQRAEWVSLRNATDYKQAGFAAAIEGEKTRNLFSLAAKLAESKQQPWLGVFRINDQLSWYIAVRDNHTILPDGDVLGGPNEIRAARERHSGFLDWNHVEGDLSMLVEMLEAVDEKSSPVKPIAGNAAALRAAAAVAAGLCVVAGAGLWYSHKQAEERERKAAFVAMQAQLAKQALQAKAAAPAAAAASAPSLPTPTNWLQACGNAILDLPLSQDAWTLEKVGCGQTAAIVTWRRAPGATVDEHPEGVVSTDGEAVIQTISLGQLNAVEMEALLSRQDANDRLRGWAQATGLTLTFSAATVPPPSLPGADKQLPAALPAFSESAFTLTSPVTPFSADFEHSLASMPGLRVSAATMTDMGWTLQGVLYAR
jgi:hypothetical protein